jgi:hypothetical protein
MVSLGTVFLYFFIVAPPPCDSDLSLCLPPPFESNLSLRPPHFVDAATHKKIISLLFIYILEYTYINFT